MSRWTARVIGLLLLLVFGLVFVQMYKTLKALEQQQQPAATTTAR
ncbi:MAG TPA: hypothetical protein VEK57_16270 [Thermoanaerobaculia bacterium]|nr:hypothetical protein [Thermoanaerobaculia bacterium]